MSNRISENPAWSCTFISFWLVVISLCCWCTTHSLESWGRNESLIHGGLFASRTGLIRHHEPADSAETLTSSDIRSEPRSARDEVSARLATRRRWPSCRTPFARSAPSFSVPKARRTNRESAGEEISHRLEVSVSSTNCYMPHWDCMVGGTVVPNLPASDFPRGANGRIGPAARGRITRESER